MKIQNDLPIITLNREDFGKHRLQPHIFSARWRGFQLQEFPIRVDLQLNQVRGRDDFFDFSEVNSLWRSQWHFDLKK